MRRGRDRWKFYRNKRILITGGLGFIGSNLAHALVEYGAEVTIVDSLIPQYGGNLLNIEGIRDAVKVNISDVRDEEVKIESPPFFPRSNLKGLRVQFAQ